MPGLASHADDGFYAGLTAFDRFEEVAEESVYSRVPDSWEVLVTDVRGSTGAIEAGRYKEVNALGVSIITAVVNGIPDLSFPYVFGGDGATLLIPPSRKSAAMEAAAQAMALGRDVFGLELRAGMVSVGDLVAAGSPVRVAKFRMSTQVNLAMFAGGGLSLAERRVKDPEARGCLRVSAAAAADPGVFTGFECSWRPIQSRRGHVVSLMVMARNTDPEGLGAIYRRVFGGIAEAAGRGMDELSPMNPRAMNLTGSLTDMDTQARVRTARTSGVGYHLYRLKSWVEVQAGRALFKWGLRVGGMNGATYPAEVVAHTDFRKFDDMLRMILDLSAEEVAKVRECLERERAMGAIAYGLHTSDSALMTCFIRDYAGEHLHFLDGSDGGYALAARQLKGQLAGDPVRSGTGE